MAYLTLIVGGLILAVGVLGQFFGLRRGAPAHKEDKRMGKIVITVGSAVVGLWLVVFAVSHLMRLQVVGRW